MPIITRLQAGKKNPHRVNVYLDGVFTFSLHLDEVVKHALKKGVVLTQKTITSLRQSDDYLRTYTKIINYLSYRPRSEFEVRTRLRQYQCTQIDQVIRQLQEKNYLNDLSFAQWFVASRSLHKTRSPQALRSELAAKGISREIITQVQSQFPNPQATIRQILHKKLGNPSPLNPLVRQKIIGHLLRLGFAWGLVQDVVKTWESE